MENRNWDNIVWTALKVVFGLAVLSAFVTLLGAGLSGIGHCLKESPWVGWILSIAFWAFVICYIWGDKDS